MSLIDKIQKAHSNKPTDYSRLYTPTAEIIEKIADDYAIEFMNWCINNYHTEGVFTGVLDDKNLLEIFKKETYETNYRKRI
jgi:hypothetical protein